MAALIWKRLGTFGVCDVARCLNASKVAMTLIGRPAGEFCEEHQREMNRAWRKHGPHAG